MTPSPTELTVPRVRIRITMVGLLIGGFIGCNDPPPEAPAPPPGIAVAPAIPTGLDEEPVEPGLGHPDHWSEIYGVYMTPELRREYLATPEDERFDRFGLLLLDYRLREDLLQEHQEDLTREEKDRYRRLTSADACRRFILEHSTAHISTQTGSPNRR